MKSHEIAFTNFDPPLPDAAIPFFWTRNDQLPIIHFFGMHREIPQELDRGNTLPTRMGGRNWLQGQLPEHFEMPKCSSLSKSKPFMEYMWTMEDDAGVKISICTRWFN